MSTPDPQDRRRVLAACAVALATAVSSSAATSPVEATTIARLERYCVASWRNAGLRRDEWEDCTQQALLELLEAVSNQGLPAAIDDCQSGERRELNRTVWRLVQRCRRAARPDQYDERHMHPTREHPAAAEADHPGWDNVMSTGIGALSDRQVRILELCRDGWRVAEIARQLDLSPDRVSDEKYKAIAKLRVRLAGAAEATS